MKGYTLEITVWILTWVPGEKTHTAMYLVQWLGCCHYYHKFNSHRWPISIRLDWIFQPELYQPVTEDYKKRSTSVFYTIFVWVFSRYRVYAPDLMSEYEYTRVCCIFFFHWSFVEWTKFSYLNSYVFYEIDVHDHLGRSSCAFKLFSRSI
jgi:hypothetical protein